MRSTLSICIPSHNTARYIRTAIESALAQALPVDEILISDDSSTDGSLALIEQYRSLPNVRIIQPPRRLSLGEHYRFLVENARTEYVCLLSADDALFKTFSLRMLRHLEATTSVGMVAGGWLETDKAMRPRFVRGLGLPRGLLNPPDGLKYFSAGCGYIISASILCRRQILELDVLPPEASLPIDWYWAIRLGAQSPVRFVNEPVSYYRFHDTNASHSDPRRWRVAAREMIGFARETLQPEFRGYLDDTLMQLTKSASAEDTQQQGQRVNFIKEAIKRLATLRYTRTPDYIDLAERGIGLSLLGAAQGH